ncbi:MAG: stage III sporulation protein AE [Clostridium sp.]
MQSKVFLTAVCYRRYGWNGRFSFGAIVDCICEQVTGQWMHRKKLLHILALSVFAGIFVKFAGTIGDGDLGETGFLSYFFFCFHSCFGFLGVYAVAEKALENLIGFMKALIPLFTYLCYGGKMQSSLAFMKQCFLRWGAFDGNEIFFDAGG